MESKVSIALQLISVTVDFLAVLFQHSKILSGCFSFFPKLSNQIIHSGQSFAPRFVQRFDLRVVDHLNSFSASF